MDGIFDLVKPLPGIYLKMSSLMYINFYLHGHLREVACGILVHGEQPERPSEGTGDRANVWS